VATVRIWTGREAAALRTALRFSVRAFAEHLGVAVRTVSKWEKLGAATRPHPDTQAILDTALDLAPEPARIRFQALIAHALTPAPPSGWAPARWNWDYETWADDLDRVVVGLSRQDFRVACPLIERWLAQFPAAGALDDKSAYLWARTLVLQGDARRDQGMLTGPASAALSYRHALGVFGDLNIPRRVAQIELSMAVIAEMSGLHQDAARRYALLAGDERLSARDRARSTLWIGTALSKDGEHDYALQVMTTASREFEDLDEAEDWAVAQQKLALACRGAGRLGDALRYIGTARGSGTAATPMQRVRLAAAHAHILLTDTATEASGLALLSEAAQIAAESGLSHQLRAIEAIRQDTARPGSVRKGTSA
jgi:transcriptional regulator with XRE-family HTH domain